MVYQYHQQKHQFYEAEESRKFVELNSNDRRRPCSSRSTSRSITYRYRNKPAKTQYLSRRLVSYWFCRFEHVLNYLRDEVFSSRSSLDALFQPFDPRDNNAVDVMVVGTKQGTIHLSIYDSFVIGSFMSPLLPGNATSELVVHASHKEYSTHSLLLRASVPGKRLYFVSMDLRFISASSEYLSLLASRSTALQNLLRYINQVQVQMVTEWKSTQDLPGRFLDSINETLAERDNRDIVQALYHSVATGHTVPSVREWLVDELSERVRDPCHCNS